MPPEDLAHVRANAADWDRRDEDQRGLAARAWTADPTTEFHLGHGDWIRLFRRSGFTVEDLIEIRPHEDASSDYGFVTVGWARQWPCEEVWRLRRS